MILLSALCVLGAFALPVLLSAAPLSPAEAEAETPAPAPAEPAPPPEEEASPVLDEAIRLTVRTGAGSREMTMAEYLPRALAGEMPAAFDPEALKAQAVALRSYALYYRLARKDAHPDADVCTDALCCAAWAEEAELREKWGADYDRYWTKLTEAAAATNGQYLVYDEAPILAVFHAASYGCTEDGAALGTPLPYLVSVTSPETPEAVTNLRTAVEVSPEEFQKTVLASYPAAALGEDPAAWVGAVSLNAAGRVSRVQVGDAVITGLAMRQLFSLRSTDFTLAWDGEKFVFRVSGYGHGLGLSQHGANLMARSGADYGEILSHYYPGASLVMAVE